MLAREKLLAKLKNQHFESPLDQANNLERYKTLYKRLLENASVYCDIFQAQGLSVWQEPLLAYSVQPQAYPYNVSGIDGSQIYPDRHEGLYCGLIQTAAVLFEYGSSESAFSAVQDIQLVTEDELPEGISLSTDLVNLSRTLAEHTHMLSLPAPTEGLYVLDGVMLSPSQLWCAPYLTRWWLPQVRTVIEALYTQKIRYASCISRPRARSLLQLLETIEKGQLISADAQHKRRLHDSHLMYALLEPGQRSAVWAIKKAPETSSSSHDLYEGAWFYMRVYDEILRIEIPCWMIEQVGWVASIILDQCLKGGGFPIALAQAHQYAVITRQDQEFFTHMLRVMGETEWEGISRKRVLKD